MVSLASGTAPMICQHIIFLSVVVMIPIPSESWTINNSYHSHPNQRILWRPKKQASTTLTARRIKTSSQMHAVPKSSSSCLWESFNALTLATRNMKESVQFYEKLGLSITMGGGPKDVFTTLSPNGDYTERECVYINLFHDETYEPPVVSPNDSNNIGWGRCVIHVSNVDELYQMALKGGLSPEFAPRDAPWGERYFHLRDPMGHELSFAKRIDDHPRWKK